MSATKRKIPNSTPNNNFRPQNDQKRGEGTRKPPKPISVGEALLKMFIHGCRKVIFFDTNIKVLLYLAVLFLSYIFDYAPFPRTYFSQSSNALNQYFVKLGWAWTLIVTLPFLLLTSFTYCCGNRSMISMHLLRIAVATFFWYTFTGSFAYIENTTGRCSVKPKEFLSKQSCLSAGHFWHGFDISGHAFILIYSCLVIIEEARVILGWDTIEDHIRLEESGRKEKVVDHSNPLKNLSEEEFKILKLAYKTFSPYIRGLFVIMTMLTVLWDVMVLSTALYFHKMIEKLISGILAVIVWYVTYKIWFAHPKLLPFAPGQGIFQYNKPKAQTNGPSLVRNASQRMGPDAGPKFMGMPINVKSTEKEDDVQSNTPKSPNKSQNFTPPRPTGPVTRSQTNSRGDSIPIS